MLPLAFRIQQHDTCACMRGCGARFFFSGDTLRCAQLYYTFYSGKFIVQFQATLSLAHPICKGNSLECGATGSECWIRGREVSAYLPFIKVNQLFDETYSKNVRSNVNILKAEGTSYRTVALFPVSPSDVWGRQAQTFSGAIRIFPSSSIKIFFFL